jgi:hypothetical protein
MPNAWNLIRNDSGWFTDNVNALLVKPSTARKTCQRDHPAISIGNRPKGRE